MEVSYGFILGIMILVAFVLGIITGARRNK